MGKAKPKKGKDSEEEFRIIDEEKTEEKPAYKPGEEVHVITRTGDKVRDICIMKKRPSGKKGGRPSLVLTDEGKEFVARYASYGCTEREIAVQCGVELNTLLNDRNREVFTLAIKKGQEEMKTSLRVAMMRSVKQGKVPAQIFMAKNYLGMSDNPAPTEATVSPLPEYMDALRKAVEEDE